MNSFPCISQPLLSFESPVVIRCVTMVGQVSAMNTLGPAGVSTPTPDATVRA